MQSARNVQLMTGNLPFLSSTPTATGRVTNNNSMEHILIQDSAAKLNMSVGRKPPVNLKFYADDIVKEVNPLMSVSSGTKE
jgi:hypothetical protein